MTGLDLDLAVEAGDWAVLGDAEGLARRAAEAALREAHGAPEGVAGIGLLLTEDARMRDLNREWRGKDKPTNVLSFPAAAPPGLPGPRPLGDIALGFETVLREADEEGKPPADHFTHLIVHGTLHLLGYDHETEAQAEIMEALEVRILAGLGVADPYAGEPPTGRHPRKAPQATIRGPREE